MLGRFLQRLENNCVQIAAQPASQVTRRNAVRSFLRYGECARRQKVLFEDRLLQFQPRPSNKSIRPLTRKQLVEHNTHRVNIRCRRHWITTYLFGRSILRSHRTQDGTRCFVRWSSAFFGQQLGNSEIQELHDVLFASTRMLDGFRSR